MGRFVVGSRANNDRRISIVFMLVVPAPLL
jgi:hypothetical protein